MASDEPRKLMEFGNVSWEDGAKRGDTEARTACSKDYMLKRRNVQADRIVVMIGGYRQHSTVEFWLVRRGESEPTPKPTVNPKDVKFIKGKIKNWRGRCNL